MDLLTALFPVLVGLVATFIVWYALKLLLLWMNKDFLTRGFEYFFAGLAVVSFVISFSSGGGTPAEVGEAIGSSIIFLVYAWLIHNLREKSNRKTLLEGAKRKLGISVGVLVVIIILGSILF